MKTTTNGKGLPDCR